MDIARLWPTKDPYSGGRGTSGVPSVGDAGVALPAGFFKGEDWVDGRW